MSRPRITVTRHRHVVEGPFSATCDEGETWIDTALEPGVYELVLVGSALIVPTDAPSITVEPYESGRMTVPQGTPVGRFVFVGGLDEGNTP